jgi:polar amino acid transport system substrate-binding protein
VFAYLKTIKRLIFISIMLISHSVVGQTLTVSVSNNAPLATLSDGQLHGVLAQAAAYVLADMGYNLKPKVMPFNRTYSLLHKGDIDVALSVLATPERLALANYSAPIVIEYGVILVARNKGFSLQRIADLEGRKIGAKLGFKYPDVEASGIELIPAKDDQTNIRKLLSGRLDGVILGSLTGPHLIEQLGLDAEVDYLPLAVSKVPLGIGVSLKRWSAADMQHFNRGIKALKASPEWSKIMSENGILKNDLNWPVAPP